MKKISLSARLRYAFDNTMSKGTSALILWLFVLSLVMITFISLVVSLTGIDPEKRGFIEIAWSSLMRTLDAGTMGGDTGNWLFLFAMLAVTLGGIFIVSLLIGVLSSGIESKLEELRKGRSFVVESNHTVILGWSSQVFSIISELVIANANQPKACIAILAPKDKVEMETEIMEKVGSTGKTHVVCRTGNPIDLIDLEIVNPHASRSIIIIAPETENPDTQVIKTILALTNNPNRRSEPYHIVAEIRNHQNLEVARLVGREEAQLILVDELISRITAQTCRQSGLSVVYTELLDFGGDEIYFKEVSELVGKTFSEALLAFEDSTLIGLQFQDSRVQLNPPMQTIIKTGDRLIAISEDDDTIKLSGKTDYSINFNAIQPVTPSHPKPEKTLILGWNRRASQIIKELDNYVASGSQVMVLAEMDKAVLADECQSSNLRNMTVAIQTGNTTERRTLDKLNISTFNHVITLGYSDQLEEQEADALTLITLLHLRDIAGSAHHFSIVSEMLDVRNRELAEVTRADDFIVSDKLISLMLSQISENKELGAVFQDLFDPQGSEIYLKPADDFISLNAPLNFYTVIEAARRTGQVALGYRLHSTSNDPKQAYGIVINPEKSNLVTFTQEDRLILLAEE